VKISCTVVVGLLLLVLWPTPGWGQDLSALKALATEKAGKDGLGTLLPLLLRGVGLTAEQKQQLKEIMAAHRSPLQELFIQLQDANKDLAKTFIVTDDLVSDDLAPQVQRIMRIREQLLWEGLATMLEMRVVLTPEQRAKAVRLTQQLQLFSSAVGSLLQGEE
jgi:Spy/CpxP family protein refolding chaperone